MFSRLLVWLLKKVYRRTMLKVVVLNKSTYAFYEKLTAFCTLQVDTDHGPFIFQFKEDRRKGCRDRLATKRYIIELIPPIELKGINCDISEKIVLAVKILIFKPNYQILTQVLADIYIDNMLIENNKRKLTA